MCNNSSSPSPQTATIAINRCSQEANAVNMQFACVYTFIAILCSFHISITSNVIRDVNKKHRSTIKDKRILAKFMTYLL